MTLSAQEITNLIKKKLPDANIEINDIRGAFVMYRNIKD